MFKIVFKGFNILNKKNNHNNTIYTHILTLVAVTRKEHCRQLLDMSCKLKNKIISFIDFYNGRPSYEIFYMMDKDRFFIKENDC
ncbi:hypothetical protein BpHYR1_028718 [Brachionus plicatilis]|uniref:Uncharacterized protein n=1 Tax=Brachionus plicatilis TaxID=10195 RepID=A0A3M7T5U2_BRAPC|nr:hypothetical protein BpHYR1_028718 [Brachionus plicatilis]